MELKRFMCFSMTRMRNEYEAYFKLIENGKSQANKIEINYSIYQHSPTEVCQHAQRTKMQ